MSRNQTKRCACGLPLHYKNAEEQKKVEEEIISSGEFISFTVDHQKYLVSRHYIALHSFDVKQLNKLITQGIAKKSRD